MEDNPNQAHHKFFEEYSWLPQLGALLVGAGKIVSIYLLVHISIVLVSILNVIRVQAFNWCRKVDPSAENAILITGATSGIGLAVAKRLFKRGYTIIAGYRSSARPGYAELVELGSSSQSKQQILFAKIDVRSVDSIRESHLTVRGLLDTYNLKLYALINNAGIMHTHKSQCESRENIRAVVETNLIGPMLMIREYLPTLLRSGGGRIVNVSSPSCFIPVSLVACYSATKAAISHYSHSLASDLGDHPTQVITVLPGALINTSINESLVADSERMMAELNEEEKEVFATEIKEHNNRLHAFDLIMCGKKPLPDDFTTRLGLLFAGSVDLNLKLEDTNAMEGFENAIMLERPPSEIFAGNRFYSYVFGPIILSLSHTTCCLIGQVCSYAIGAYSR